MFLLFLKLLSHPPAFSISTPLEEFARQANFRCFSKKEKPRIHLPFALVGCFSLSCPFHVVFHGSMGTRKAIAFWGWGGLKRTSGQRPVPSPTLPCAAGVPNFRLFDSPLFSMHSGLSREPSQETGRRATETFAHSSSTWKIKRSSAWCGGSQAPRSFH